MTEVLKKFGRYFLLDQIAQGGMAEIYRARLAAPSGAGRLIVIKRVQASYGENSEFLQMFRSEIKVMMGFNHPNIVQLYDFGEENNQPYIAMEFVDGKTLRQFSTRFTEQGASFPIDAAVYVIEQASCGLHYAHSFKDKITGQPLSIVHRDISPQNVIISYEGNVKIIDFGIAKASTNSEATRAGVIKGKPSYLSPEQISGDSLDGRSDIFALGIVLWELLTGKRLFVGENDLAVLKQIESCQTFVKPPSTVNHAIPKELDYIVLKALAKQPDKRYQSAEEFQRTLHKFLYSFNPEFNPGDLSYYAKDLFKNEIIEDRKVIQRLNERVEQVLAIDMASKKLSGTGQSDERTAVDLNRTAATGSRQFFDSNSLKGVKVEIESVPAIKQNEGRSKSRPTARGSVSYNPEAALVRQPRAPIVQKTSKSAGSGGGGVFGKILVASAAAAAYFLYIGPAMQLPPFDKHLEQPQPVQTTAANHSVTTANNASPTRKPAAGMVLLKLHIVPSGGSANIQLSGRGAPSSPGLVKIPKDDPVVISAPIDSPIELTVEAPGFQAFRRETIIETARLRGATEWSEEIQLEPAHPGAITIPTLPTADAIVNIEGNTWIYRSPIRDTRVPAGKYNIELKNELLGMGALLRDVVVEEGKKTVLPEIRLQLN